MEDYESNQWPGNTDINITNTLIWWGVIRKNGRPLINQFAIYNNEARRREKFCKQIPQFEKILFGEARHSANYLYQASTEDKKLALYSNRYLLAYKNHLKEIIKAAILKVDPKNSIAQKAKVKTDILLKELNRRGIQVDSSEIKSIEEYQPIYEAQEERRRARYYELAPTTSQDEVASDQSPKVETMGLVTFYSEAEPPPEEPNPLENIPDNHDDWPQYDVEVYIPEDQFKHYLIALKEFIKNEKIKLKPEDSARLKKYETMYSSLTSFEFDEFIAFYKRIMERCIFDFRNSPYWIESDQFAIPVAGEGEYRFRKH